MNIGNAPLFLRLVLWADAALSFVMALILIFGAAAIASITALPKTLLFGAGWALTPWVAFVAWTGSREPIRTGLVRLVVVLNVVWVVESICLLFLKSIEANSFGVAFVLTQALGVFVLAALQTTGLRALRRRSLA